MTVAHRQLRDAFEAVADIYVAMERCVAATGCERVVVLKTHNGGGRPNSASPIYSSVMYEWPPRPIPVRKYWRNVPIDRHYTDMMRRLLQDQALDLLEADMPEGADLKAIYRSAGIVGSRVKLVHLDVTAVWYVSITYQGEKPENLSDEGVHLRNVLRTLIARLPPSETPPPPERERAPEVHVDHIDHLDVSIEEVRIKASERRFDRLLDSLDKLTGGVGEVLKGLATSTVFQGLAGLALVVGVALACVGSRQLDFSGLGVSFSTNAEDAAENRGRADSGAALPAPIESDPGVAP